jgi:hypothetical protein
MQQVGVHSRHKLAEENKGLTSLQALSNHLHDGSLVCGCSVGPSVLLPQQGGSLFAAQQNKQLEDLCTHKRLNVLC